VSAASFLPVRLVSGGPNVDTITLAFRFLPPTVANEAVPTWLELVRFRMVADAVKGIA
jgi:hypothetical protein